MTLKLPLSLRFPMGVTPLHLVLVYVYRCSHAFMYMRHMHGVPTEARRGHQIPLELEWQAFVSLHLSAGH